MYLRTLTAGFARFLALLVGITRDHCN